MPHIVVEIAGVAEADLFLDRLFDCLIGAYSLSDAIVPENVKLRARTYENVRVAGSPGHFVHITVSLMRGPTKKQQSQLADLLWRAAADFFPDIEQVTIEVREMEPETYRKRIPIESVTSP